jgi:hypothetical protein
MISDKKTKIVATLGPACSTREIIKEMIDAGVNVFRVNFSHADYADVKEKMKIIRDLNDEYGYTTAILGDLQGPKLRVGVMNEGVIVHDGDLITFTTAEDILGTAQKVFMKYKNFPNDVNTGERLNILFGEDSWMSGENGADMIWNPSDSYYAEGLDSENGPRFGGKHVIYIMRNNKNFTTSSMYTVPAYDSCQYIYDNFVKYEESDYGSTIWFKSIWESAMWCAIPVQNPSFELLETDVKIKIRTSMPYFYSKYDSALEEPENNNYPMFSFNTADIKTLTEDNDQAVSALDLIRVVPNPYYGNSYYENSQLDNYVRITNLPDECVISIFNVNGGLVRRIDKTPGNTFVQWDLKNTYGISIASGVYIVHINVPGVGEKIIKWFGALRPIDLNNF